jgi:two-component system alkaline phosphatase synthesis response regulator PhoP
MQRRVLIIEDEKLIILSTQMVLEASGFRVDSAMDGEEGIKKARESAPDLILLDIMMPGIDGWETLTRLKQDPQTADVPVVIFTAREHSRGHQRSAEMGAADYFRKPFEPEELVELVEKHCGQRQRS